MADGVDLAIGAEQRRHQEGAAEQAFRVAQRADGDVDARALACERRKNRRYHHRGDVLGVESAVGRLDAHAVEHGLQALLGEMPRLQRVAGVVEADDQAVTDQLVLAHAFEINDVLDTRGGVGAGCGEDHKRCRGCRLRPLSDFKSRCPHFLGFRS